MSNESQNGYLWVPFAGGAEYYEIRTRDITGGSGATRLGYLSLGPISWPTVHNTWGVTTLGTWPSGLNEISGLHPPYFRLGPWSPPGVPPATSGYLGIDYFDFCPVASTYEVPIILSNRRNAPFVLVVNCVSNGVSSAQQVIVPAAFGDPLVMGTTTIFRSPKAVCDFVVLSPPSETGILIFTPYYSFLDGRIKDHMGFPVSQLYYWIIGGQQIYIHLG